MNALKRKLNGLNDDNEEDCSPELKEIRTKNQKLKYQRNILEKVIVDFIDSKSIAIMLLLLLMVSCS